MSSVFLRVVCLVLVLYLTIATQAKSSKLLHGRSDASSSTSQLLAAETAKNRANTVSTPVATCQSCGYYSYTCSGTGPNDDPCAVCRIDPATFKSWDNYQGTCARPKCGVVCVDDAPNANNCGGWYTGVVECPLCVTTDGSMVGTCKPANATCGVPCDFNMPGNRSTCKGDCPECVADGPTSQLGSCKTPRCGMKCATNHDCGKSHFSPGHTPSVTCATMAPA